MTRKIKPHLALLPLILLSGYLVSQVTTSSGSADLTVMPDATTEPTCSVENTVFRPGEEIIYKIYYNWKILWVSAGEVRFRVEDHGDQYHMIVQGRTYESYDPFYRVRDQYETFVDKETLLPETFISRIEEGRYRRYNKFEFDQDNLSVTAVQGVTEDTIEVKKHQFNSCMHDIVSILYNLRNYDMEALEEGEAIPVSVFLEKQYPINVVFVERAANVRIRGMGKATTDILRTELIDNEIFDDDDQLTAYVSRDGNRVPLMIESPLSVGKMKAVLVYHNGLKYPLDTQ